MCFLAYQIIFIPVCPTVLDTTVESTVTLDFGGWEAHTRGIGSKLMLKMGYEYGKGKCPCP